MKKAILPTVLALLFFTFNTLARVHFSQTGTFESPAPSPEGILYVDSAVAVSGDGSSWTQALKYLSDGTKAAETNTAIREIHVAKGTYYPTGLQSDTTRDGAFAILRGGLKLYGGYPSGGGQRNIKVNRTVLSGNINAAGDAADNSLHIMVIAGIDAAADSVVVDGFSFSGGYADRGGFMIYNGLEVYRSTGGGMAVHAVGRNTLVRNCTFFSNHATFAGGGLFNDDESTTTITHCVFLENTSEGQGGGMTNWWGTFPTVISCVFSGNSAVYGGGMVNSSTNPPDFALIVNCLFSGNTAVNNGGGMYNTSDAPSIINCTFSGNSSGFGGGGIASYYSSPQIRNCVIWGNSTGVSGSAPNTITYSLVQEMDADAAAHNLDGNIDPLFTDAPDYHTAPFTGGDYRLLEGSPVTDRGSNEALPPGVSADIAGNVRVFDAAGGGLVDLGAFEFQGNYVPIVTPDANGIVYVDSAVAVSGDGSSWTSALKYLSDATTAANQGNVDIWEIRVAKGTYYPAGEQRESGRDSSFAILRGGLKLYGGYPTGGGATEFGVRDPAANPTVLSGDVNAAGDNTDNSYHVLVIAGIPADADSVVADGFTISGGNADTFVEKNYNGQAVNALYGGGLYAIGLSANTAVRNCTISANHTSGKGGGIFNYNSSATLTDLIVKDNSANNGGGICIDIGSNPRLDRIRIINNSAAVWGGGLYNNGRTSSAIVSNVVISGNTAKEGGGVNNSGGQPDIRNAVITGNKAENGGGVSVSHTDSSLFTNMTISGNTATSEGGGMYVFFASAWLTNSIIWGNSAPEGNEIVLSSGGDNSFHLNYCLFSNGPNDMGVAGTITGSNLLVSDPRFIDAPAAGGAPFTGGDYRLQPGSPAINAGTNDSIPSRDSTDVAGNSRIYGLSRGGIVDLGAHEFTGGAFSHPDAQGILYVDSAIAVSGDGSSWANALKFLSAATKAARSKTAVKEIHVAKGTYYPTGLQSDTDRHASFAVERAGLKLLGGYPNGGGTRDYKSNPTVLSGDINVMRDTVDNSYHVMILAGDTTGTDSLIVDGFTITGGNANNRFTQAPVLFSGGIGLPNFMGGGMATVYVSSYTAIRNCTFYENHALNGAGMLNYISSPIIAHCSFRNNHASPALNMTEIGGAGGGGMMNFGASPKIDRCLFTGNTGFLGGAMGNYHGSPTLLHNTFSGNSAIWASAIYNSQSSPTLVNCLITGNSAIGFPAGAGEGFSRQGHTIFNRQNASPRFLNCTISGNTYTDPTAPDGDQQAAVIGNLMASLPSITNSIISGNEGAGLADSLNSAATVRYSLVQGIEADAALHLLDGNTDPLFTDTAAGDYSLQETSAAIDMGFNDSIPSGIVHDLAGNARIYNPAAGGIVDLGAYEFHGDTPLMVAPDANGIVYVDSAIAISGDGSSWVQALKFLSDGTKAAETNTDILEIHVAKGTYYPTGLQSDTTRDSTFAVLRGGLKLYGGYPNGGGKRDFKTNRTLLSGDINAANDNLDNSYHVMVIAGIDAGADSVVVDGFTLSKGNSNGGGVKPYNERDVQRGQGGGIVIGAVMTNTLLRNCLFSGNIARQGGGMANFKGNNTGVNPVIANCLFSGNLAYHGGGIWNFNCSPTIINCTFAGNKGEGGPGGALYNNTGSSPVITNSILYGNNDTKSIYNGENCIPVITYSMVEGMAADPANHNPGPADPLFIDAPSPDTAPFTGGNYRLQAGSPVLNKGNNDALPNGITADLDGNARIFDTANDGIVDMGAYEFQDYPLIIPEPDASGIFYVDSAVAVPGNGSSWAEALRHLSKATKAAEANTAIREIHVAKGTYYPTGLQSDTTRNGAFAILRGGLKLYGGYPTGGGERDVKTNRTLLSGNIGGSAESADNSYHIMVIAGIPASADSVVVDGFMLTGGNAGGSGSQSYNGQQVPRGGGGGMALYAVKSNTLLRNCTFSANQGGFGGGILNYAESTPTITHCLFLENTATSQGGGMANNGRSYPTLISCIFSGNSSGGIGGGMTNNDNDPTDATLLVNCLFSGNTAASNGGGMYNSAAVPIIINCTFSGNSATYSGGGIFSTYGYPLIRNSVIWGNSTGINESPPDRIIYSLVQGMDEDPAAHNLDGNIDPLFTDAPNYHTAPFTGGDYRLQTGSLLIDRGSNEALPPGVSTDIAGNTRVFDAAGGDLVDVGAYEFQGACPPVAIVTQPEDQTVCSGAAAVFSAGAETEAGTFTYQWQVSSDDGQSYTNLVDNEIYSGTASSTLTIAAAGAELDNLLYHNVISTECSSKTSDAARLHITQIVITGTPPEGNAGLAYTFTFNAGGGTAPYTWSLPQGPPLTDLDLNKETGELSGTPGSAGTFKFTVQAKDASGCSATLAVSLTIAQGNAPVITFPELDEVVYGTPDIHPRGTSGDNREVEYVSADENIALITPQGLIRIVGAGTVEITASLPSDPNYEDAAPVVRELVISPATLTVTASDESKVYDGMAYNGGNGVTVAGWQYEDSDELLQGTISYSGNSQGATGVGNYEIIPAGYDALNNYLFNYLPGTLTIIPAGDVVITFPELGPVTYGVPNFDPEAFSSDDRQVAYMSSDEEVAMITTEGLIQVIGVGTTEITATLSEDANYEDATPVIRKLVISPATLTVTANEASKTYDGEAYSGGNGTVITGWQYEDNESLFGGQLNYSGTSQGAVNAGSYEIVPSGYTAQNYSIDYQSGTFLIKRALLMVTAKDTTRKFGEDNPVFTLGFKGFAAGESADELATPPVAVTTATKTSPPGTYPINASGAASGNYDIAYASGTLTVVPAKRTLAFDTLPEKTYEDADFDPGAEAHPEEEIIYSSSDTSVAEIVDGKIHINGAGTAVITASLPENAGYENTPSVSRELIVHKAPQTIDFARIGEVERDAGIIALPVGTSSGLPVTLSSSDEQVAVLAGENQLEILRLGTSFITATQKGNENYLPAEPVSRELRVVDPAGNLIKVHQVVSPNSDGINEFLLIEGIRDYPENKLTIVTRNGVKVFEMARYDNGANSFRGLANTVTNYDFLPQGTYFYLLEFKTGGAWKRKTGWLVMKYSNN